MASGTFSFKCFKNDLESGDIKIRDSVQWPRETGALLPSEFVWMICLKYFKLKVPLNPIDLWLAGKHEDGKKGTPKLVTL